MPRLRILAGLLALPLSTSMPALGGPSQEDRDRAERGCPHVGEVAEELRREGQRGASWRAIREAGYETMETPTLRALVDIIVDAAQFSSTMAGARATAEAGCWRLFLAPPDAPRAAEPTPRARVSPPVPIPGWRRQ